jgi:hypothetical protein
VGGVQGCKAYIAVLYYVDSFSFSKSLRGKHVQALVMYQCHLFMHLLSYYFDNWFYLEGELSAAQILFLCWIMSDLTTLNSNR